MTKRMLIDATHAEETRVVVLDGNRLEDFDVETSTKKQLKGNIYLAKVVRVEPSLQAAFVEYGGGRHGFLAFGEIHPDYYQIPVADRQRLLRAAGRGSPRGSRARGGGGRGRPAADRDSARAEPPNPGRSNRAANRRPRLYPSRRRSCPRRPRSRRPSPNSRRSPPIRRPDPRRPAPPPPRPPPSTATNASARSPRRTASPPTRRRPTSGETTRA